MPIRSLGGWRSIALVRARMYVHGSTARVHLHIGREVALGDRRETVEQVPGERFGALDRLRVRNELEKARGIRSS